MNLSIALAKPNLLFNFSKVSPRMCFIMNGKAGQRPLVAENSVIPVEVLTCANKIYFSLPSREDFLFRDFCAENGLVYGTFNIALDNANKKLRFITSISMLEELNIDKKITVLHDGFLKTGKINFINALFNPREYMEAHNYMLYGHHYGFTVDLRNMAITQKLILDPKVKNKN